MKLVSSLLIIIVSILILSMVLIDSNYSYNSFAQSGDAIGQNDDGDNDASQNEDNFQSTELGNMCVSGETTVLGCNSLSAENIGVPGPGEQGPAGPPGPPGIVDIYTVEGPEVSNTIGNPNVGSLANCETNDRVIGGGYDLEISDSNFLREVHDKPSGSDAWFAGASGSVSGQSGVLTIKSIAHCVDTTP